MQMIRRKRLISAMGVFTLATAAARQARAEFVRESIQNGQASPEQGQRLMRVNACRRPAQASVGYPLEAPILKGKVWRNPGGDRSTGHHVSLVGQHYRELQTLCDCYEYQCDS